MTGSEDKNVILSGDIGGTKTNLGFFSMGKKRPVPKVIETYSSREASGLEEVIERFLTSHPIPFSSACFGIAGPVINGRCKATNLPWDVSEALIKKYFSWPYVRLINDLAATALAIPLLNSRELYPLNQVRLRKGQNIALIASGTGLGEALLVFCGDTGRPVFSEGGHADFAPNCLEEVKLWQYLHQRFGHVSAERLLSGPGLVNIYSWLKDSKKYSEPLWLKRKIKEMDPAGAITETAMRDGNSLCVRTLEMFVSILGAVAGNLALTGMTTGGLFLGGGIPPKMLPFLKKGIFMKAFTNKGRFRDVLEKIPVRVILNTRAALLGAAKWAFENQ